MNELRQIRKIREVEFPQELHGRIMRSLYLRQFKLPLFIINGLLLLNMSLSGWHLLRNIQLEMELSNSQAFLYRAWGVLSGLSTGEYAVLLLNALILGAGLYLLAKLNKAIFQASRTGTRPLPDKVLNTTL